MDIGDNWSIDLKEMIKFKRNDLENQVRIRRLPYIDQEERETIQIKVGETIKAFAKELSDSKLKIGLNKVVDSQNRTLCHYAC